MLVASIPSCRAFCCQQGDLKAWDCSKPCHQELTHLKHQPSNAKLPVILVFEIFSHPTVEAQAAQNSSYHSQRELHSCILKSCHVASKSDKRTSQMKWSVTKHAHRGSWSVAMCFDSRWASSYVAISTKMNPCLPGCSFGHRSYIQANTSWASREVFFMDIDGRRTACWHWSKYILSSRYNSEVPCWHWSYFDQCQQALRCCTAKIGWAKSRSFNSFGQKHFLWLQFI